MYYTLRTDLHVLCTVLTRFGGVVLPKVGVAQKISLVFWIRHCNMLNDTAIEVPVANGH